MIFGKGRRVSPSQQRAFAFIPHQCCNCDRWVWLEEVYRWQTMFVLYEMTWAYHCVACERMMSGT